MKIPPSWLTRPWPADISPINKSKKLIPKSEWRLFFKELHSIEQEAKYVMQQ